MTTLKLSGLPKTWILDLDGTIFKHNGFHDEDIEVPLRGVSNFFDQIPRNDMIIILTSRESGLRAQTETSLKMAGIRYDILLMNIPVGERILVNDVKPSGLITAHCVNVVRDLGLLGLKIEEDPQL